MTRHRGFTLVELAVVMTIVALILASLMYTLAAQSEQRSREEAQRRLEEAKELLLTFAVVNGRLPCPAAPPPIEPYNNAGGTGVESPAGGGSCTDGYTGFLPARTLGFQPSDSNGYALDAWGNPIRYAVSKNSTVAGATDWNFTTAGAMRLNGITVTPTDLLVCASQNGINIGGGSCAAAVPVTNQNVVVFVLWSQGKNFRGTAAVGGDETVNNKHRTPAVVNDHAIFVFHPPAPSAAPGGEYDDMLLWVPVGVLYGRMIAAGMLP